MWLEEALLIFTPRWINKASLLRWGVPFLNDAAISKTCPVNGAMKLVQVKNPLKVTSLIITGMRASNDIIIKKPRIMVSGLCKRKSVNNYQPEVSCRALKT